MPCIHLAASSTLDSSKRRSTSIALPAVHLCSTWNGSRLALSPSGPWDIPLYFFLPGYLPGSVVYSLWPITGCFSFSEVIVCLVPWCPPTAGNTTKALWVLPLEQAPQVWERHSAITLHLWPGKDWNGHLREVLYKEKPPPFFLSIFLNILYSQSRWQITRIMELDPDHPKVVCLILPEIYQIDYMFVLNSERRS